MKRRLKLAAQRGWQRFRRRVISGLFLLVPLWITWVVVKFIYNLIAGALLEPMRLVFKEVPNHVLVPASLLVLILVLWGVGTLAAYVIGRRIIELGEAILARVPVVASVYGASKQVLQTMGGERQDEPSKSVVLVPYPTAPLRAVGFCSGTMLDPEGRLCYRVFVPTVPNPTTGFFHLVPLDQATPLDITVDEAMRLIMSVGVLAPAQLKRASLPNPPS